MQLQCRSKLIIFVHKKYISNYRTEATIADAIDLSVQSKRGV